MSGNEMQLIEPSNVLTVFTTEGGIEPYLEKIRAEVSGFVPDISTEKGRKEIASMAYKVAKSKTVLDGLGKGLTEDWAKKKKAVDAERKHAREYLDTLRDEVRAPLNEWERIEAERVERIKSRLEGLLTWAQHTTPEGEPVTSDDLKQSLEILDNVKIDNSFGGFIGEAITAKENNINLLHGYIRTAEKREAEAEELERLRREAVEREQKERDEKLQREAAERARAEAEAKAKAERDQAEAKAREEREKAEAKAKAEREAIEQKAKEEREAAERRELELKLEAERAEREKLEAEQRATAAAQEAKDTEERVRREAEEARRQEAAEAAKREANKRHRTKINNAAIRALIAGGLENSAAILAIGLIEEHKIPAVTISY